MTIKEKIDKMVKMYEADLERETKKVSAIVASGHVPDNHWQDRYQAEEKLKVAYALQEIAHAVDRLRNDKQG